MRKVVLKKRRKKKMFSKKTLKQCRRDLEEATEEAFAEFARASRASWQKAKNITLD